MKKIIFFVLCVSIVTSSDVKSKYSSSLKGRLIGEQSVEIGYNKFTASFRRANVQFCTASLLSNRYALTTASCLKDFLNKTLIPNFNPYTLVAGRLDIDDGSTVFNIEEVQQNRRFNFSSPVSKFDFGLITMMENDEIESEYLGWAVQLTKCSCFDGKVVVTGWETNHGSVRMKKIKQHIINKNKYGLHQNNAVIFAVSNEENETYSEVDLGAPLSMGNIIIGVLVELPTKSEEPAIFIDICRSSREINFMMNNVVRRNRYALPRKRARHDSSMETETGLNLLHPFFADPKPVSESMQKTS